MVRFNIQLTENSARCCLGKKVSSDKWLECNELNNSAEHTFILEHPHDGNVIAEPLTWTVKITDNGIRFGVDEKSAECASPIQLHEWTDVMSRSIMTVDGIPAKFHFRATITGFDPVNRIYTCFVTGAHNILNEMVPADHAAEVMEIPEINTLCNDTTEMFADTLGFFSQWKAKVIEWAMETEEYDIIVLYSDSLDTPNHIYSGFREGTWHSDTITQQKAEEYYEMLYNVEGVMIEWLLDNAVGEDTQFAVCSDHGGIGCSVGYLTIYALAEAGLLVYDEETEKTRTIENFWSFFNKNDHPGIIWEKTRAYPTGSCFVNVNLQDREPFGTVPPEEFEATVAEIIRALHKYDPDPDGPYSIAFAVPGEQAGFFGQGGPMCGDVVFGLAGSRVGGCFGGVHAHQMPSARVKTGGDMRPICVFVGSKFKKNVILDRPADITDIAPTLCFAAGVPQPKDATGGVLFAAFNEEY